MILCLKQLKYFISKKADNASFSVTFAGQIHLFLCNLPIFCRPLISYETKIPNILCGNITVPSINFSFLGSMFCFVSVLSWVVGEMRLREVHFPVTVLHGTVSLSGYTWNHGNIFFWGGENLTDLILEPVAMLSPEGDILIPVINFLQS